MMVNRLATLFTKAFSFRKFHLPTDFEPSITKPISAVTGQRPVLRRQKIKVIILIRASRILIVIVIVIFIVIVVVVVIALLIIYST